MFKFDKAQFAFIIFVFVQLAAQAQVQLSPKAKISIFTIAPGRADDPLFTQFGHSAFRVADPINRIDWIYDYGVFDFNAPNFYVKFARGKLKYMVAKRNYDRFEAAYRYYDRTLTEQILNLDSIQKQQVFDYLETNNLPENKYYLYDFFYDNCATRLPGVIKDALGTSVQFDTSATEEQESFRDLIEPWLTRHRWGDLGIDLALGLPTDKIASRYQYMFLPHFVKKEFDKATITKNGNTKPLVSETIIPYEATPDNGKGPLIGPGIIFSLFLFFVIAITYWDFKRKSRLRLLDFILFLAAGLVGLLIIFLWFFTDHSATANNLNIIWALPTHLIVTFFIFSSKKKTWVVNYFLFTSIVVLILLLSWYFLPQPLHYSMFPFALALCIRAFYYWFFYNKIT
ncbi:MAG: DUF4105 domain-containing protein, partial [Bacteroidota bacterium]